MNPSKIESEAEIASLKLKLEASIRSKILVTEAISTLEVLSARDSSDRGSIDASATRLRSVIAGDDSAIDTIKARMSRAMERAARPGIADHVARLTAEIEASAKRDVATAGKRPRGGA